MRLKTPPSGAKRPSICETLENRQLLAVSPMVIGVNANSVDANNYASIVSTLRTTATRSVRLWYSFSSYETRASVGVMKYAGKFKADGFDVMLAVVPIGGIRGTPAQTQGLFNWLTTVPGLVDSVDRWEIGNEPDIASFWQGTLQQYVTDFLAPAAAVLHGVGEKVVSGGVSWNPAHVKTMVDAGMLQHVDAVGYHPYRYTAADLQAKVTELKGYVGTKPIMATEWNIRGIDASNPTAWTNGIKSFWPIIRDNFEAAYYFAAVKVVSMAGPAGVVNSDGTPNEPYYSTYLSFKNTVPTTPRITSLSVTNLTHSHPLFGSGAMTGTVTLDRAAYQLSNVNFPAHTVDAASVKFTWNGTTVIDNTFPFSPFGQEGATPLGKALSKGTYTLTAQAYSLTNATGTASATSSVTIKVVDSADSPGPKDRGTGLERDFRPADRGNPAPNRQSFIIPPAIRELPPLEVRPPTTRTLPPMSLPTLSTLPTAVMMLSGTRLDPESVLPTRRSAVNLTADQILFWLP